MIKKFIRWLAKVFGVSLEPPFLKILILKIL